MRCLIPILGLCLAVMSASGATLEKLSLDDMIQKSTGIVRGKVQSCTGEARGPVIYTRCRIAISEKWKGSDGASVDVRIPGGSVNGQTQTFSGSPALNANDEYVLFLWTGKSGITQLIGLSQGVLTVRFDSKGDPQAQRDQINEKMVDVSGNPVQDRGLQMSVKDLKDRITRVAGSGGGE